MKPFIKIITNIDSSVFIDDKYIGLAKKGVLFKQILETPGDYLIRLVEKKICNKFSISKVVHVINDTLIEFDFADILLAHQEFIPYATGIYPPDDDGPWHDLKFKRKNQTCEIWSSQYDLKLSTILDDFDSIESFGYNGVDYLLKIVRGFSQSIISIVGSLKAELENADIIRISTDGNLGIYRREGRYGIFKNKGHKSLPLQYSKIRYCSHFDMLYNENHCAILDYDKNIMSEFFYDTLEVVADDNDIDTAIIHYRGETYFYN